MINHVWAPGTNYQVDFYLELFGIIFALILLIGYIYQTKHNSIKFTSNKNYFILIIITHIFTMIFSAGTFYLSHNEDYYTIFQICLICSYIFYYLQIIAFNFNFYHETKYYDKSNKIIFLLTIIIVIISALIFFISYFTKNCISVDENGIYHKGNLFFLIKSLAPTVLLLNFITIFKIRKMLPIPEIVSWSCYILLPIISLPFSILISPVYFYLSILMAIFICYIIVNVIQQQHFMELENQNIKDSLTLTQAQIDIMMSQIQPHFLFNALASISALCYMDSETAQKATNKFADYLRMNLNSIRNTQNVPFSKELEHVQTYLWLEKIRFNERLNIEYDIMETEFSIPPLCIQPLVENAVKHGICAKSEGGTVLISSSKNNNEFIIEIKDDGAGFDINDLSYLMKKHKGLANCEERIKALCSGYIDISSTVNKGTTVVVHIPEIEENNNL